MKIILDKVRGKIRCFHCGSGGLFPDRDAIDALPFEDHLSAYGECRRCGRFTRFAFHPTPTDGNYSVTHEPRQTDGPRSDPP